ncbi:MAG: response regulator, partial [Candidatus Hydrogenedentes bacterium]|nr:response regulator [Candidatus Hydrogenedentota bacterium]
SVNTMASNLTSQVRDIAVVATAVAQGNLNKKVTVEVKGEILELKNTINTMVDQLRSFASEVTRVALDVGTEGKLGGQATVEGVSGTWRELTESVNTMASNLTDQVRGIAAVVTAVANGNLEGKLSLQAKGEIGALAETINDMIDTLNTFAGEVTRVARDVGVKGELGGQANVPGAAGTWRDLTDNVNELASNLTTQVRAIGDVATAVAKGDLSPTITVEARGEVAELKDNLNRMIRALQETTRINEEQDWLKTNLTNFTRMLQGQRDLASVAHLILSELAPLVSAQHGVFYLYDNKIEILRMLGSYAYKERKDLSNRFKLGEGLIGQCAMEKKRILITDVPNDYVRITSGLGNSVPYNIVVLPVLFEGEVQAIIELASFNAYTDIQLMFLEQLTETLGIVLSSIAANTQTMELLRESQAMSVELQSKQMELQQTNEELEEQARLLAEQKAEVERKNQEVEEARLSLQEKADQLALTSKYKSQFLANMSHELRTPLNSLLILAKMLADNSDKNLTPKQVEFANTIYSSGGDLLELINEILDLSKIESGIMAVEFSKVPFKDLDTYVRRSFEQVAQNKGLTFEVNLSPQLPRAVQTDAKRLKQILKNLLSNAVKFTDEGNVSLLIDVATTGWSAENAILSRSEAVIAFSVQDTGIGIPEDKRRIIFEAFQQVDGGTSRKYGGTGLGLSISREIARLLGGEIQVESEVDRGSTFTLYLPLTLPQTQQIPSLTEEEEERVSTLLLSDALRLEPSLHAQAQIELPDDRELLGDEDRVLLVIEDDVKFARILIDMAREKGFKVLCASHGEQGLALARHYKPEAITLDIRLPEVDGWSVLDRLKHDLDTRHIPVQIISIDAPDTRLLQLGALNCLEKPVSMEDLASAFDRMIEFSARGVKNLLVIGEDESQLAAIVETIGNTDVQTTAVGSAKDAVEALKSSRYDCVVVGLGSTGTPAVKLIETLRDKSGLRDVPIVLYANKDLSQREALRLAKMSEHTVVKNVCSMDRLLDETALFLHRMGKNLPEPKRLLLQEAHQNNSPLEGKRVLVVDDDIRNIFAITSVLETQKMQVLYSETGQGGIELLTANPNVDAVLMDVMMPEMDGYEAMRVIRGNPVFESLPIIAVTAKAMKGDREKCLEAGASDYIKKPIDMEQLLSLLRVWTFR